MKLRDLIDNIDFNTACKEDFIDLDSLCEELRITPESTFALYDKIDSKVLTAYYIKRHVCTDTLVGSLAYFLEIDNKKEFIGISKQDYRKSDVFYYWKDSSSFLKLKKYMLSLLEDNNKDIQFVDLEQEIPDNYQVMSTVRGLVHDHVVYKKEKCRVIHKLNDKLKIQYGNEALTVDLKDCYLEYWS